MGMIFYYITLTVIVFWYVLHFLSKFDFKVVARQVERRLEESKVEAGQLRNRLTLIEKNINDADSEVKLHRKYLFNTFFLSRNFISRLSLF